MYIYVYRYKVDRTHRLHERVARGERHGLGDDLVALEQVADLALVLRRHLASLLEREALRYQGGGGVRSAEGRRRAAAAFEGAGRRVRDGAL